MHDIGCGVGHSIVDCLGGMTMDMGDSAFELSMNASFFGTECQFFSPLADFIDGTNVLSVSRDTSSHESLEVHKYSQHSGDDHGHIPFCAGFRREQWVDFDVVLLNELGVPVVNGICRNSNPLECIDANPLGLDDVGVFLEFFASIRGPVDMEK